MKRHITAAALTAFLVALWASPSSMAMPAVPPGATPSGATPAGPAASRRGTLPGIDVSHWQGSIDWRKVDAAGIRFVIAKATEGDIPQKQGYFTDPNYTGYKSGATGQGIAFTGYHYAQPDGTAGDAVGEADLFVSTAGLGPGYLKPALDLEETGGLGVTALQNWVQAWLDRVKKKLAKPIIYTNPSFWQTYMGDTTKFADEGYRLLWIAHWTEASQPTVPAHNWGGYGWTFWQYTSCGSVAGISGCVDRDRYNGSKLDRVTIK